MTAPAPGTYGYVYELMHPTLEDSSVGGIMEAARKLKAAGQKVEDVYEDAAASWSSMAEHYQSPDTHLVTNAFPENMEVFADQAKTSSHEAAGAALEFSSALVALKSRYNVLNTDIHRHNLHPLEDLTAHAERAQRLEERKLPILEDLAEAERTARDRINAVNITITVAKETVPGQAHTLAQRGIKFVKAWSDIADNFDVASAADVFSGRHVDPEQMILMFRAMDSTKMSADTVGPLKDALTPALFQKVKDLFPKDPGLPKPQTPLLNLPVNMDAKPGSWAEKLGRLPDSDGFRSFTSGLDKVGRAAGVVDTAVTYYDTYSSNYNESVLENPQWSAARHRTEAVTSAAIEGTAETLGKVGGAAAGQAVGRVAGAAVGQALIPIPGVGAAVGGIVGGFVGSWAGEKIGGAIGKSLGDEFNEWRKDTDIGSVGDVAGALGQGLVDGGASVVKGVKGLFGFG
jgi:hypothetical protein